MRAFKVKTHVTADRQKDQVYTYVFKASRFDLVSNIVEEFFEHRSKKDNARYWHTLLTIKDLGHIMNDPS